MTWKSWFPYYGDQTVRRKLEELDHAGIGVPMLIILFLQKTLELGLKELSSEFPTPLWLTYLLSTILIFVAWVYDRQLQKAKDKAKEKIEE